MKITMIALTGAILLGACSPISQQAQQDLAKPVNCATATGDIRVLQSEKAHVASQILAGVQVIAPAGAILSAATHTTNARLEVATGEYNRMIDEKIATIRDTCGM